jgi:hypothetical protein
MQARRKLGQKIGSWSRDQNLNLMRNMGATEDNEGELVVSQACLLCIYYVIESGREVVFVF